jgi:hypothetical protein
MPRDRAGFDVSWGSGSGLRYSRYCVMSTTRSSLK